MSPDTSQTVKPPLELTPALSPDEARLALLGVVDFEGDWEAMEAATTLVVDGPAKASLIRHRLAPAAAQLRGQFATEVGVLDLLAARHWFDTQPCQSATRPKHAGAQKSAAPRLAEDDAGAQEEPA